MIADRESLIRCFHSQSVVMKFHTGLEPMQRDRGPYDIGVLKVANESVSYRQLPRCLRYALSGDVAIRLAISQVIQFELTELTAKTQFSQSVLDAAGSQSSQFRGHRTD
jgi:hypothetical protein